MAQYAKNMKKYKEIFQKRVQRSDLMKIPLHELDRNKEHRLTEAKITSFKSTYRVHDREVADHGPSNPFFVPPHQQTFGAHKPVKRNVGKIPVIMKDVETICDIDETFYKVIEGRPLREIEDIKVYVKKNIRDITLTRAMIGYHRDEMMLVDNSYANEVKEYNKITELYYKTKTNFTRFAKNTYDKAKAIQELAQKKDLELQAAQERLDAYSFKFVKLRNKLANIGCIIHKLNIYRRFLYNVAPLAWRELYDEDFTGCSYYFQKFDSDSVASQSSLKMLQKSVASYKKQAVQLYFESPVQLFNLFEDLSKQCLNYLQIEAVSNSILVPVCKGRDYLKRLAVEETNEMQDLIEFYKIELKRVEEQEVYLKQLFEDLLKTKFNELYASFDSSKLFTCVQYVNTRIFGNAEDPKDSIFDMARQLERLYVELTMGMDDLNQKVVKAATNQFFSEDLQTMKNAHLAQRQLREFNILKKSLVVSFEPRDTRIGRRT